MLNQPNRHNSPTPLFGLIAVGLEQSVNFSGEPQEIENTQGKKSVPDLKPEKVSIASRLRILLGLLQAKTENWA